MPINIEKRVVSVAVETEADVAVLDGTEAEGLIEKFNAAKAAIISLEKEKKEAEEALRALLGAATVGTIGGVDRLKLVSASRPSVKAKEVMESYPEIWADLVDADMARISDYTILKSV